MHYPKYVLMLLCLSLALSIFGAKQAKAETIRDVVKATWPQGIRTEAVNIKYAEGGAYFNDGYCGFGIIPSTAVAYGLNTSAMDPYACSRAAYRIYVDVSWGAWTTAGSFTPGVGKTPVSYY